MLGHPRVRGARVLDRRRVRMLRREPVADVDDEVAEAREHEAHQPVRVLRQQVERAAVHVEHDRPRLGPVHRAVDVELVPVVVRPVDDVALDLDAVALRVRRRVQPAGAASPSKNAAATTMRTRRNSVSR